MDNDFEIKNQEANHNEETSIGRVAYAIQRIRLSSSSYNLINIASLSSLSEAWKSLNEDGFF